jgi:hypothetical protein
VEQQASNSPEAGRPAKSLNGLAIPQRARHIARRIEKLNQLIFYGRRSK